MSNSPSEQQNFEAHIMKITRMPGEGEARLRKHVYGQTWAGAEEHMPTYTDNNTEALWRGWQMRAAVGGPAT